MFKKFVHPWLALLIAILTALPSSAFAETELSANVISEMKAFGIIEGNENGDLNFEDKVNRAEFATMMVRLLKMEDWAYSRYVFSDVSQSDWFYENVMRLVSSGIIDGFEDGTFRPYDGIQRAQAAKMLVAALGYNDIAKNGGGYPNGYVLEASKLGIFKNTQAEASELTRADAIRMMYNCLDIKLLERSYTKGGNDSYEVGTSTLRDSHIFSDKTGISVKKTGYIDATAQTWLTKPYPDLKDNEVVIDGTVMNANGIDVESLLGMEVTYYVTGDNEDGPYTLKSIFATDSNKVFSCTDADYDGAAGGSVSMFVSGKKRTYSLDEYSILVRNMRPVTEVTDADYSLEKGSVRLVDNDSDGKIEYVFIEEFESVYVKSVTKNGLWINTDKPYGNKTYFDIYGNNDISYFFRDSDGNEILPEELKENDVLSIVSDNSTVYKMVLGRKDAVEGEITKTFKSGAQKYVKVNDEEYPVESGLAEDFSVGDNVSCRLNFRGEIAKIDIVNETDLYGYILGAEQKAFKNKIRIVEPGKFRAEVKVDDEEEDNTVETQILKGANAGVKTFDLASKVKINGVSMSGDSAYRQLSAGAIIRYKLNGDNEVNSVETPEIIGDDIFSTARKRKYNGHEQIFGGIGAGAFAVTEKTNVLCVPNYDGVTCLDDYLAKVEILDSSTYVVNGYDIDEETEVADLIVIEVPLRYSTAADVEEDAEAILKDMITEQNEDGENITKLVYYQDGIEKTTEVDGDCDISDLEIGDIFLAALGRTTDKIAKVEKLINLADASVGIISTGSGSDALLGGTISIGYPMSMAYNVIDDLNNRRVDALTMSFDRGCVQRKSISINVRNTPDIYLYKSSNNEITKADTSIIPLYGTDVANADIVVVYEKQLKTRLVVIVEK